jgi:hypothetical protein
VAEGNAAIHAARALLAQLLLFHVMMELVPIPNAFEGCAIEWQLTEVFDKACRFAHGD